MYPMSHTAEDEFYYARNLALKTYTYWMGKLNILSELSGPETLPSIFYKLGYPSEDHDIFETILHFLELEKYLQSAGGTFSLVKPYESIKVPLQEFTVEEKKHPIFQFIDHGMRLLEERLEGGTGIWDIQSDDYIFERGFTQSAFRTISSSLKDSIESTPVSQLFKNPKIGIYANYPEYYINAFASCFQEYSKIKVITPNQKLKTKAITFCELHDPSKKYSQDVVFRDELLDEGFDVLFIPSGLAFHFPLKVHFQFFKDHLRDKGYIFFKHNVSPHNQIGIEPLYPLHPNSYKFPNEDELSRFLKSLGFSRPKKVSDQIAYVVKE